MSERENIFIKTGNPVGTVAELLADLYHLEPIPIAATTETKIWLRGRAQTASGHLGFVVEPNRHRSPDPDPEDVQAIDDYEIQVNIWYGQGRRHPDVQLREAWLVFDRLVYERPDLAMLLCHDVTFLVAAYLPGLGVHTFPPETTMDAPDLDLWRPWLASSDWVTPCATSWPCCGPARCSPPGSAPTSPA